MPTAKNNAADWDEARKLLPVGLLVCVIGLIFIGAKYISDERENTAMRERGIQLRAPVIDKETVRRDDGGTSYRLKIQFHTDKGELVEFKQFVLEHTYNSIILGDLIEIEYLPEKPKQARLEGEPKELDNPLYIMGFIGVVGICFVLGWWALGRNKTQDSLSERLGRR